MSTHTAPEPGRSADNYRWLGGLILLLGVLMFLFTFVGRIIVVNGSSMEPTLQHGEVLLLQRLGYAPRRGDLVVLSEPAFRGGESIVKRVIAVGGQTVDIDYEANTVFVDGAALDEPYLPEPMEALPAGYAVHVRVPEGSVFVLGDNRNHSGDSRDSELGAVDARRVLGRVFFAVFPFGSAGPVG